MLKSVARVLSAPAVLVLLYGCVSTPPPGASFRSPQTRVLSPQQAEASSYLRPLSDGGSHIAPNRARTHSGDAGADPIESIAVAELGVLSFNMRHKDRPDELAVMARHLRSDLTRVPDFILCQEAMFQRRRGEENTAAVLAAELGYHWRGTRRKSDREGVAIVSRYPFAYSDELHLEARTAAMLLGFKRVSVMGEFEIPGVGLVRVVNVHLAYSPLEHHIRARQLDETLKWMAERDRQAPADLVVLGGDFNTAPDRMRVNLLTNEHLSPRFVIMDGNTDRPTRGSRGNPTQRMDYIFLFDALPNGQIAFVEEQLLWINGLPASRGGNSRLWLSDHVPVLHRYRVWPTAVARSSPSAVDPAELAGSPIRHQSGAGIRIKLDERSEGPRTVRR